MIKKMVKVRVSVTIEDAKNKFLDKLVKKEIYRNKSHAIEEAIKLLMSEVKDEV